MNSNISTNKNIYIILLVGVSLSVVVGLLITRKLILGKGSAKNLDTGNNLDSRSTKDYSSYFNDKYRWHKDSNTKNIVNKLHPSYRGRVAEFFSKIEDELGLTAYATSGYRTFEKQAELHKQNSQNAKAGFSIHNFALALDVVEIVNGKAIWNSPNWLQILYGSDFTINFNNINDFINRI